MNHIMIDIEAFGTDDNAFVCSIGAAVFDPWAQAGVGNTFYNAMTPNDNQRGAVLNAQTVLWWMRQSEKDNLIAEMENPKVAVDLWAALQNFSAFWKDNKATHIWANNVTFDINILTNAYSRYNMSTPWHYMDITCMSPLRLIGKHTNAPSIPANVHKHDALEDAIWQAKMVQNILSD